MDTGAVTEADRKRHMGHNAASRVFVCAAANCPARSSLTSTQDAYKARTTAFDAQAVMRGSVQDRDGLAVRLCLPDASRDPA
jgi:hypothetical protein